MDRQRDTVALIYKIWDDNICHKLKVVDWMVKELGCK
jgi:hypothetical protein